jgi:thiol-disulfide isomerase/thioredoxin
MVSRDDFSGAKALVVMFICNHCPYVKHVAEGLSSLGRDYAPPPGHRDRGVALVAINSNDVSTYPADSPEQMVREAEERKYLFPYLYDADQQVAKAYRAACTPDFFVFDRQRQLCYRGQLDDSRPENGIEVTGCDLRAAIDAALADMPPLATQKPSIGCNIKWIADNGPDYFSADG